MDTPAAGSSGTTETEKPSTGLIVRKLREHLWTPHAVEFRTLCPVCLKVRCQQYERCAVCSRIVRRCDNHESAPIPVKWSPFGQPAVGAVLTIIDTIRIDPVTRLQDVSLCSSENFDLLPLV